LANDQNGVVIPHLVSMLYGLAYIIAVTIETAVNAFQKNGLYSSNFFWQWLSESPRSQ
jgi:hypothetical protein